MKEDTDFTITPYDWQKPHIENITALVKLKFALCVRAKTGAGKTIIACETIKNLQEQGFFADCLGPFKVMVVCPTNAVEQWSRYIRMYSLNRLVEVCGYDALGATYGNNYIRTRIEVENGFEVEKFSWFPWIHPKLFILDEVQKLKNDCRRSFIIRAVANLAMYRALATSATPFSRICEAKTFCLLTRKTISFGWSEKDFINEHTWPTYAQEMAGSLKPEDHSPTSMRRLLDDLGDYIYYIKRVPQKHYAQNSCDLIDFDNESEAKEYNIAYQEYCEKLAKIDRHAPGGIAAIWVAMIMFRIKAEYLRRYVLARLAKDAIDRGKAAIIGVNFRKSLASIVDILVNDYNIPRSKISVIWGGLDDPSEEQIDLNLGTQSRKSQQEDIDKFQTGESQICLFTFKSGGGALNLQHTTHYFGKTVSTLPREGFFSPTYSEQELIQALGRDDRVDNASSPINRIIHYNGTIETAVMEKTARKMESMNELCAYRESWLDILVGNDVKYINARDLFAQKKSELEATMNDES